MLVDVISGQYLIASAPLHHEDFPPDIDDNKRSWNNHKVFCWIVNYYEGNKDDNFVIKGFASLCFFFKYIWLIYLIPVRSEFLCYVLWSVVTMTDQCLVKHEFVLSSKRIYTPSFLTVDKIPCEMVVVQTDETKNRTKINWFYFF